MQFLYKEQKTKRNIMFSNPAWKHGFGLIIAYALLTGGGCANAFFLAGDFSDSVKCIAHFITLIVIEVGAIVLWESLRK